MQSSRQHAAWMMTCHRVSTLDLIVHLVAGGVDGEDGLPAVVLHVRERQDRRVMETTRSSHRGAGEVEASQSRQYGEAARGRRADMEATSGWRANWKS
jgi:hypothetical protein